MAMEKRTKEVGGKTYGLLTPPVLQAMPLVTKTAALLGPVVGSLGLSVGDSSAIKNEGWAAFSSALQMVDPMKAHTLLMEAVSASKVCVYDETGTSFPVFEAIPFEKHFSDHRQDVYLVLTWCLWECIRDFFPQAGAFLQKLQTSAPPFISPKAGPKTGG